MSFSEISIDYIVSVNIHGILLLLLSNVDRSDREVSKSFEPRRSKSLDRQFKIMLKEQRDGET